MKWDVENVDVVWYDEDDMPIGIGGDPLASFEKRYKSFVDTMLLAACELEDIQEVVVQNERIKGYLGV